MRASLLLSVFVLAVTAAGPSFAQTGSGYSILQDDFSIMVPEKGSRSQPEPWLAPKYRSPRGTVEKVVIPLYVPETGRTLPNLPSIWGAGPGGAETFQDRAARCAHQAGVYGSTATGNRNAYVGSCVNQ